MARKYSRRTPHRRYFISSLSGEARTFARAVRGHWGIENGLHWGLDVSFRQDDCRVRKGHGTENLTVLRHIAINPLKQEKSAKLGIRNKRLRAAWDNQYLFTVLTT